MSYVKAAPADAEQAAARIPGVLKKLATSHAAATAGFRTDFLSPEQAMDAIRTWRESQDHLREGVVYAAGLAIAAGAPSASAHRRLGFGRLDLQSELFKFFGRALIQPPVKKRAVR